VWTGGDAVIRQAISCDICGTERKQTNHWFVAYDQAGELRVSGLDLRNRLHPGTKHLCGQACVHKLVDDFMNKAMETPALQTAAEEAEGMEQAFGADASLTSIAADEEFESSARLLPTPVPVMPEGPPLMPADELLFMPGRIQAEKPALPSNDPPRFTSRNRRAEARNRERAPHTGGRRPDSAVRRRSK
jgi:hypothetical protein